MNTNTPSSRTVAATAALIAGLAVATLAGCRGERSDAPPRQFIPDMDDSPKFKNQSQTAFFSDGRIMRPYVPNTVAFGDDTSADAPTRGKFLKEDTLVYQGFDPAGPKSAEGDPAYAPVIPAAAFDSWIAEANMRGGKFDASNRGQAIAAMIKRGEERFNIYCSACHGYIGDGRGLVGVRWMYAVPSFHDAKYKDRGLKTGKDGYLFHTIRYGVPETDPSKPPKMPAYADKVSVNDAWAIVAYLRTLQAARTESASAQGAESSIRPAVAAAGEVEKEGRP